MQNISLAFLHCVSILFPGSQVFSAAANPLLYETLFQAAQMVCAGINA